MPDMLRAGSEWLASQRAAHLGTAAIFRRGALECALTVTIGQSEFEREESDGLTIQVRTLDLIVPAAALVLEEDVVEPAPGDVFEIAGYGTFEVASPGSGPAWHYDPHRVSVRIHTREVE